MITEFDYSTITSETQINPSFFIDRVTYNGTYPIFFGGGAFRGFPVNPGDDPWLVAGSAIIQYNPKIRTGMEFAMLQKYQAISTAPTMRRILGTRFAELIANGTFTLKSNFDFTFQLIPVTDNLFQNGLKMQLAAGLGPTYCAFLGRRGMWLRPGQPVVCPASYFFGGFQPILRYSRKSNPYLELAIKYIQAGIIELYSDSQDVIDISDANGGTTWDGVTVSYM